MTPKGARQQHPNHNPRATALTCHNPVLSQATSRSLILPSHCRATGELEGEGRGDAGGQGPLGSHIRGCLGAVSGHS